MVKINQWPDSSLLESVYYNQQSGAQIYRHKENGLYYWSDVYGMFESTDLNKLVEEERRIDPRMGWN